jgi:hypothetical protein
MIFSRDMRLKNDYNWQCAFCYYKLKVNASSPLIGYKLSIFELSLRLWIRCSPKFTQFGKLQDTKHPLEYFKTFRNSLANYWHKKVKPYLKLPGIVEIDETKCNGNSYSVGIKFP